LADINDNKRILNTKIIRPVSRKLKMNAFPINKQTYTFLRNCFSANPEGGKLKRRKEYLYCQKIKIFLKTNIPSKNPLS